MSEGLPILRDALKAAGRRLTDATVPSADFDARALAAHVLHMPLSQLALHHDHRLTPQESVEFDNLVARRCAREPLQYITGETEFYGRVIRCDRRALIPRADTETLAEVALELARDLAVSCAVDIGTGTGAIAIALAAQVPHLEILATDNSPAALDLAAENLALHDLAGRIALAQGDCLEAVRQAGWWERTQMIVSNPPYVRADEFEALQPEIARWEPREALVGADPDGLGFYRRLLADAGQMPALRAVAFEVGVSGHTPPVPRSPDSGPAALAEGAKGEVGSSAQAPAVAQLIAESLEGFEVSVGKDYAGIERVVSARR